MGCAAEPFPVGGAGNCELCKRSIARSQPLLRFADRLAVWLEGWSDSQRAASSRNGLNSSSRSARNAEFNSRLNLALVQDTDTVALVTGEASINQHIFGDFDFHVELAEADEFLDQAEVDHGETLLVWLREAALWQTAIQRHLAAFVAADSDARTRFLTFDTTTSGLTRTRTWATSDALAFFGCAVVVGQFMKLHVAFSYAGTALAATAEANTALMILMTQTGHWRRIDSCGKYCKCVRLDMKDRTTMTTDTTYRAGLEQQFHRDWVAFFAAFARFEHALIKAPYLKHGKTGVTAEAGWAGFATDLGAGFLDRCRAEPELEKLFTNPPMLLKVDQGEETSWKKARAINSVADWFLVVKDVRNNLFHGDIHAHSEREERLMIAALKVLDMAFAAAQAQSDNPKMVEFCEAFRFQRE